MEIGPDKEVLIKLVTMRMPFGKYKGQLLCDIPENYLIWYQNKGFPPGKLGEYLANVLVIKANGLTPMFFKLKRIAQEREKRKND